MTRRHRWLNVGRSVCGLLLGCAAIAVAGCATYTYRSQILAEVKELQAELNRAKDEQKQLCANRPEICKPRLKLDSKMSPEDPKAWSYEVGPPYRVAFDISWGRLRQTMKRKWLGIEYYAEVIGPLCDRVDLGEVSERDGWLIARKAAEQARDMLREQLQSEHRAAQRRDAQSWQAWQSAASVLLTTAVVGLNAYTAANTQIRQPPPATVVAPPAVTAPRAVVTPARPAPTVGNCTYRLWALGGQSLCTMSDGTVVAR